MIFQAYTLEKNHIETEFLRRELNIEINFLTSKKLNRYYVNNEKIILVVSDPKIYKDFLKKLKGFAYILLLSDEKIQFKKNLYFLFNKKKFKVIRNYSINPITISSHFQNLKLILSICDSLTSKFLIQLILDFLQGLNKIMFLNLFKFLTKDVLILPLGYTNNFAKSFTSQLNIQDPQQSLILYKNFYKKTNNLGNFVGQKGNIYRQYMLNYLGRNYYFKSILKNTFRGFNGTSASQYTLSLLNSHFSIVPPGNANLETFRFTESLVCNSFPICLPASLTIPTILPLYKKCFKKWHNENNLCDSDDFKKIIADMKAYIAGDLLELKRYLRNNFKPSKHNITLKK